MGSLLVKLDLYNMALDLLKEEQLTSINEVTAPAQWLNRNYGQQRDYLMSRHWWKFAMGRASLAVDPTAPAFGWSYRYHQPNDILRLYPLTVDGELNSAMLAYEIEGDYILTDYPPQLKVRYIRREQTEGNWSNLFCEVLAIRLANKMAHWMTGKENMVATLSNLYRAELDDAERLDCLQAHGQDYYDDDIIAVRYS